MHKDRRVHCSLAESHINTSSLGCVYLKTVHTKSAEQSCKKLSDAAPLISYSKDSPDIAFEPFYLKLISKKLLIVFLTATLLSVPLDALCI